MIGDAERSKLQVGYKQAVRALNENKASKVFVAEDCDDHIKDGVSKIAMQSNTPVFFISTMKELGNMCKIEVGASCAFFTLKLILSSAYLSPYFFVKFEIVIT